MKKRKLTLLSVLIIVASVTMVVRVSDMVNAILHYNTDGATSPKGVAFAESNTAPSENEDMYAEAPPETSAPEAKQDVPMQDTDEDISRWTDADDTDLELPQLRIEMFKELITRRENLDKRQRILHQREALLRAAEQELERKYDELTQLRSEIGALLEQQYEGMKAKDAARIFNTLSIDVLLEVMSSMSERKIAPVIAAMDTERARQVTVLLAEQKKLPSLPVQ